MHHLLRSALLLALLPAAPALAQEGRPLALDEAVAIAEARNPAFQRALAELEVSAAELRASRGLYLPELSLGMTTGGSVARRLTGEDAFGRPARLDEALSFRSSYATQSLTLSSITLFDGGRRRNELNASRASDRAVHAMVGAERAALRAEVSRRYRAAQRAEFLVHLEAEALARAEERQETARRLLRLTVNSPLDLTGAEIAVAEQEQLLERARGTQRAAMLALREVMGWMDGTPLRLTEPVPDPFDPASLDAGALVAAAMEHSPSVQRREEEVTAAAHAERAARAGRLPRISTSASYDRTLRASEFHALFEPNPLDQGLSFGFNLQLPLFTQFRTSATLARAAAQLGASGHELAATRLSVEREVRGALIELENAHRAHSLAARVAELHRSRVEMAEQQYRLGAVDFRELQDVVERAGEADRRVIEARFDFAEALIALEERVGSRPA
jgi:outer membrane protein